MSWVSQRERLKETGQLAYLQLETTNTPGCPLAELEPGPTVCLRPASRLARYLHVALGGLLLFSRAHPGPQPSEYGWRTVRGMQVGLCVT